MNNHLKTFFLFLVIIPFIVSFTGCDCNHKNQPKSQPQTKNTEPSVKKEPRKDVIKVITSTDEFNKIIQLPTVVKFTAPWCPGCKTIEPLYEEIAHELGERYQFVSINVDNFTTLANTYKIRGIPLFLFFNKGEQLKGQLVGGNISKNDFLQTIEKLLNH